MSTLLPKKAKKALVHINPNKAHHLVIAEFLIGGLLSFWSLIAYMWLAQEVLAQQTNALDVQISHTVYALRSPFLTTIMSGISFLGSEKMILPLVILIILLFWRKHREDVFVFAGIVTFGFAMNLFLKYLIHRPRPEIAPLYDEIFSSFPSGHSMNSVVFYFTLAYFIFRFSRSTKLSVVGILCATAIVSLIGFSRVYLGVHYPTDIIGGFIAGFWWIVTMLLVEKTLLFRRMSIAQRRKTLS